MAFILDKVSLETFYANMLLGIVKILDKNPRIDDIQLERFQACTATDVIAWEQLNSVRMPDDLKDFYLATNGFKLLWSYSFSDQESIEVGSLHISNLSDFTTLSGYNIRSPAQITVVDSIYHLQLSSESKVFSLAPVDDNSKVCLIYLNSRTPPSIWLADSDLKWHFLSNSFIKYLMMSLAHLGLPYWQFCFTPQGIPSWAEQMFLMDAPHLPIDLPYETENRYEKPEEKLDLDNYHLNQIDTSLFKSKSRQGKTQDMLKYRNKKH